MDFFDLSTYDPLSTCQDAEYQKEEDTTRRKGEKPTGFRPSMEEALRHTVWNLKHRNGDPLKQPIVNVLVPRPYPPCTLAVNDLEPIQVSDMLVETHHRGKRIALNVMISSPWTDVSHTCVEDENGIVVTLEIHNQGDARSVHPAPREGVCIVKEPFLRARWDGNGSYHIVVDHVNDVLWLENSDERIPEKWRTTEKKHDTPDSHEARAKGNEAVQQEMWLEAKALYSQAASAAKTSEEERLALLNRSLANLKLGLFENALQDAIRSDNAQGGSVQSPSEKAIFRKARALYEMGDYRESVARLQELLRYFPESNTAGSHLKRALCRLREQETGKYSWQQMYQQAQATVPLIDVATFRSPVEVRTTSDKGEGLFLTCDVKAGDLLLCEKAWSYVYADKSLPIESCNLRPLLDMKSNTRSCGGHAKLISQAIGMLSRQAPGSADFEDLYRGDHEKLPFTMADGHPVVDTFLVAEIIRLNSFAVPRSFFDVYWERVKKFPGQRQPWYSCGIWLLASRINHSCVANCRRTFIGDVQLVRATADLKAGTELLFSYFAFSDADEHKKGVKKLQTHWGFKCKCALCLARGKLPTSVMKQREDLRQAAQKELRSSSPSTRRLREILEQLDKTWAVCKSQSQNQQFRFEIWDLHLCLADLYQKARKVSQMVEALAEALRCLGFVIVVDPALKHSGRQPRFEIRTWGISLPFAVPILHKISEAYEKLAPELVDVVDEYARIAYSIEVGEDLTFPENYDRMA